MKIVLYVQEVFIVQTSFYIEKNKNYWTYCIVYIHPWLTTASVYLDNYFVWLLVDVHVTALAGQRPGEDDAVRTQLNQCRNVNGHHAGNI